jgi:UDP-3-O-[3-hydroxymyristoyl] glucosamine N-acyltransferase
MILTAADIAALVEGTVEGDETVALSGIAGIREAGPGELTFMANRRYAADIAGTQAGAVLVPRDWTQPAPCTLIRVDNPDRAFATVSGRFAPPPVQFAPGVHPTAIVASDVVLDASVHVGPYCVIEPGCRIGTGCVLLAGVYVGHASWLGDEVRLYPHVSIRERCRIGHRVIIHNGSVIGSDGFGYVVDAQGVRTKIQQIGIVEIGDDVEIGANVTIDRARFGRTRIGKGTKIDNLVQIAHNVVIGEHSVIVAQVGIAGSTSLGARVILGGQAGVVGHVTLGEGAIVGGQAGVTKDVPAGAFVSGFPAMPHEKAMRIQALTMRLPEWRNVLTDLEKRLAALEKKG